MTQFVQMAQFAFYDFVSAEELKKAIHPTSESVFNLY